MKPIRLLFMTAVLAGAWCVMTVTHEAGHVVAGLLCGGTLRQVDLAPWRLPYSVFDPDPEPLVTLWSGPMAGVIVPILLAGIVRTTWAWLVAHFCLLANGAYLATAWASGDSYLDTARLLQHGAHPMTIFAFCVSTTGIGYCGFRQSLISMWQSEVSSPSEADSLRR